MHIAEQRNAGGRELCLQVGLRVVDDRQVRFQREQALHVRVEQSTEARQPLDFWRKLVEAADADDAIPGADREQHLRRRRDERDDAMRLRSSRSGRYERDYDRPKDYTRRKSSHRKTGPPITAVMMPTGNSTGANAVRATRSQMIRNAAPNSAAPGSARRWPAPTISRTRCGTMMPTNGTGPPSDTAAPVHSDALTSATRSARSTSTPRDAAASRPSVIRSSTRGSVANPPAATPSGTSAEPIGEYPPISSEPISHLA